MNVLKLNRWFLLPLVLVAVMAVGCSDDDDNPTTPTAATAQLRVAHLSPDAPAVDVWLNGEIVSDLTNVPFPAVSAYLTVPAATAQVQVFVTGTSSDKKRQHHAEKSIKKSCHLHQSDQLCMSNHPWINRESYTVK